MSAAPERRGSLAVSEVFGPTVQGEGPTAGRRAAFLRLARCNLDCSWCDTPYTWDWKRYDPEREVRRISTGVALDQVDAMDVGRVVITGGEPMLQQRALLPLLEGFTERHVAVEIETNGTRSPLPELVERVERLNVSLKLPNSGVDARRRLRPQAIRDLLACGKASFKFVARSPEDLDEVAVLVARFELTPIWIMPEGTTSEAIVERTRVLADSVIERGWSLGTRLHILAWGNERGR